MHNGTWHCDITLKIRILRIDHQRICHKEVVSDEEATETETEDEAEADLDRGVHFGVI